MSKPTAPPADEKPRNGHKRRPLPAELTPAVAQAVLEDAVLEAAADLAALSATLGLKGAVPASLVPETPEEVEILELASVPGLGPARRAGLADIGITTLAALSAADPETLAQVRGLAGENVRKIKDWLAENAAPQEAPEETPLLASAHSSASQAPPEAEELGNNPTPPSRGAGGSLSSPDPTVAASNQHVQDALAQLDAAVAQIRAALPGDKLDKKLARQLDAVSTVASELPESFDTLSVKSIAQGAKTLDKITALILEAAGMGRLSEKKQLALRDELKERRRRLEKTLGG